MARTGKKHISVWREKDLFAFLQNKMTDLTMMEDTMSRWDCISDRKKLVIELKCRRKHYDTLLIEKKKFDALMLKAEQIGYRPMYINSTPQGIFGWYLDKVDIEFKVEHKHPATTAFNNKGRVPKEVGYLSIEDGVKLK